MNTTFKIEVSETIIHQASALFNASLEDIFTELLQNSRRAGATSVHISLETIEEQELLCIEDNGIGMFDHGLMTSKRTSIPPEWACFRWLIVAV